MRTRTLIVVALLAGATPLKAAELEIALSGETVQLALITPTGLVGLGGGDFDLGAFFNDDDDLIGSLGLTVAGVPAGDTPFSFALGTRLYLGELDSPNADVLALSVGGHARYTIPSNIPLHLTAGVFYAPDIVTSGDIDDWLDFIARFEVEIVPRTSAFIGYRKLGADITNAGDHTLDDNVHIGVHLSF
ncbi:MAG: YfaZ family outer membrane protein [Gammaproteobacteria bacterium]